MSGRSSQRAWCSGRVLTRGRKEPSAYQGGTFQNEGTASTKLRMRQDDLGVSRGEKVGQRGGGSRERGQDQRSEGLGDAGAHHRPAWLSALEMWQVTPPSLPSGSWHSRTTSDFPFSVMGGRWKVCRDERTDEELNKVRPAVLCHTKRAPHLCPRWGVPEGPQGGRGFGGLLGEDKQIVGSAKLRLPTPHQA